MRQGSDKKDEKLTRNIRAKCVSSNRRDENQHISVKNHEKPHYMASLTVTRSCIG
jgi:hypothetical protein